MLFFYQIPAAHLLAEVTNNDMNTIYFDLSKREPSASFLVFLAIFRNEITTILTSSISEEVDWVSWEIVLFFISEVPKLLIRVYMLRI